ncbi:hypothetical protein [Cellulomonas sp. RIT-PI-Y]|uniref:hypothetical protein n=1 Tax=Cellulomonas sp. RIT-PI-Y TaxID=3035297 RepID=UPI0021D8FA77|nr:hypothetical protein [Cellulomonas sp. RIT-PI-Y]
MEQTSLVSGPLMTQLTSWAHLWFSAAVRTDRAIESNWDDDDPMNSIGERDALSLVLIDALRNVERGAQRVLDGDHDALRQFDSDVPSMKSLRDRLEHYDAYLSGEGHAQQSTTAPAAPLGMRFIGSGSRTGGHTIFIHVDEKRGRVKYQLDAQSAVLAARRLMLTTVAAAGMDDAQHRSRCHLCRPDLLDQ